MVAKGKVAKGADDDFFTTEVIIYIACAIGVVVGIILCLVRRINFICRPPLIFFSCVCRPRTQLLQYSGSVSFVQG